MSFCVNILLLLLLVLCVMIIFNEEEKEGFYVHGHGHGYGPGRRYGRPRWGSRWRSRWGYRQPPPPRYLWYNPWYWYRGMCKNGCTSIGNGNWGCQYPGSGPNDCWFASDCYGCGN